MEEDKNKGGRPHTLKINVGTDDYKALEKMGSSIASPPDQIAAMLLHVALEKYEIAVLQRADGDS